MSSTLVLVDDRNTSYITTRKIRFRDRLAARRRSLTLDRALAAGTSPDSEAALALRAQALIGKRARRAVANQIRRIILDARRPSISRWPEVIISHRLVLDVESDLSQLAVRLLAEEPVDVRGVAGARILICDGCGPLYAGGRTGANELRAAIDEATEALEPDFR
jgi:hypothetical protein